LRDATPRLRELGAEVVAIGTGGPKSAAWLVEDYGLPYPVLLDEEGEAARIAGMRRIGFFAMFHPQSYSGTARAWRGGHRIGRAGRRVDQLGSTFVVAPGGKLLYEHRDRHSADHAPLDEILSALRD
jgi:peroxiredoxin